MNGSHQKVREFHASLPLPFYTTPTVGHTNCYCALPRTVQNKKQINGTNKKGYYKIFRSPLHFALQLLRGVWQTKIDTET